MSQGFSYAIQVNVLGSASFQNVIGMSDRFETSLDRIHTRLDGVSHDIKALGSNGSIGFKSLLTDVESWVAGLGVAAATIGSLKTTAQIEGFNRAITFSAGAKEGATNIAFVNSTVEALALPLKSSLEGFKLLSGSMKGTGVSMAQTRDIFYSVGEAATVMGLGADDTQGVFRALSQMASKGKVNAEELRGQLGERLSGAFYTAATAMGYTTEAFDKLMETGKVVSGDFLPKFAAQLHKEFKGGVEDAVKGATANFNKFENAILRTQIAFGEHLLPTVLPFLNDYLIPSIGWIGQHADLIITLAGGYMALKAATMALTTWQWLSNGAMAIGNSLLLFRNTALYFGGGAYGYYAAAKILATSATFSFTTALEALNLTFLISPIFWIPVAIAAVVAGFIYAYQKCDTFRAAVVGVGHVLLEFGSRIAHVVQLLWGMSEILWGTFSGNQDLIKQGAMDTANALKSMASDYFDAGHSLANAYNKGWNNVMGNQSVVETSQLDKYYGNQDALSKANFSGNGAKPDDKTKKGIEAITGGGEKSRNVTISINTVKVSDQMTVVNDANHNAPMQLTDEILKKLVQIINSGNAVQLN
jgi:tape measure domain-containing protein